MKKAIFYPNFSLKKHAIVYVLKQKKSRRNINEKFK
jgi:hypothetical protein